MNLLTVLWTRQQAQLARAQRFRSMSRDRDFAKWKFCNERARQVEKEMSETVERLNEVLDSVPRPLWPLEIKQAMEVR